LRTRLMIVDELELVRFALAQLMSKHTEIQVVAEAANGKELLDKLLTAQVDVLLLDMNVPDIAGSDLIAEIRKGYPSLRILVLGTNSAIRIVQRAMKAGASGYITKNSSPTTLFEAIHKVATSGRYLNSEMAERLAFASTDTNINNVESLLSQREMQIYPLLIEGTCIKSIANTLSISDKTVSTHKSHILAKLGIKNVPELVRFSIQNNLLCD